MPPARRTVQLPTVVDRLDVGDPHVGMSINEVRTEIDGVWEAMREFRNQMPDEVMQLAMGYSARLGELRVRISRIEDRNALWKLLRTREIDPTLEELRLQYQGGSRLESVRDLDFRMESGRSTP